MSNPLTTAPTTVSFTSADRVALTMQALDLLSPEERDLVVWFASEVRRNAWSHGEAGKRIGIDGSNIGRIFNGNYAGNWQNVLEKIRTFRHLQAEREKMTRAEFVETSVWERVRQTCDMALINQMPAILVGVSQIGKTHALKEYMRRSHHLVRYVRIPAGGTLRDTLFAIADACGVGAGVNALRVRARILSALNSRTLLIIDELHQLTLAKPMTAVKVMEFIREILDETGCGLVVCGTRALQQELLQGQMAAWLDQFEQRCITRTVLDDRLSDRDIGKVAEAYGVAEKPDSDTLKVLRTLRMNRLVKLLMLAGTLARKQEMPTTWDHFMAAYTAVNR